MTVTPTSPSSDLGVLDAEAALDAVDADLDLDIPEEVPSEIGRAHV